MNKGKIIKSACGLAIVGALGMGSTLAYLQDSTQTLTNTFTAGDNINIQISEKDIKDTSQRVEVTNTAKTQDYGKLVVGKSYDKDPRVDLVNSGEAYVYMSVEGMDQLINTDIGEGSDNDFVIKYHSVEGLNSKWVKIANMDGTTEHLEASKDGIYVYTDGNGNYVKLIGDNFTESLFDTIMINEDITSFTQNASEVLANGMKFKAFAIQTEINTAGIADQKAIETLKK